MIGLLVLSSLLSVIIQSCCPADPVVSCPVSHENCACSHDVKLKVQLVSCQNLSSFPEFAGNDAEWTTIIENSSVSHIFANTFTFLRRKSLVIRNNSALRSIHNFAFSWSKLDSLVVEMNVNLVEVEPMAFNNLLPSDSSEDPCRVSRPADILSCSPKLRLADIRTFTIEDVTFARAPHIRFLEMANIRDLVIKPSGIAPLTNLQGLMISRVESLEFDSSLLDHLQFLQFLSLSYLPIGSGGELPPQLFVDTPELNFLFLDHNHLTRLDGAELTEMTQLRLLQLNGNNISVVPEWLLRLPAKVAINLNDNPIVCNCSLHVIKELPKLKVSRLRGLPTCVSSIVKMEFCDNQVVSAMFNFTPVRPRLDLDCFLLILTGFFHFYRTVSG